LAAGCIAAGQGRTLGYEMVRVDAAKPRCTLRASAKILDFSPLELFVYDCFAVPEQDNARVRDHGRLMQHVEQSPLGNLLDIVPDSW
jgi:hypothetical protein